MSINLDIVMDTPEQTVDMKSGLETMQGVSDATRLISEALLKGYVPRKLHHKSGVRTTLKKTFKGSYGHVFSVDVHDPELQKKFNKIGRDAFSELIAYFVNEALYKDSRTLSPKAQGVVDGFGEKTEELVVQLRVSALEKIHSVSEKYGYDVKIRYRKNSSDKRELALFDSETSHVLTAVESGQTIDIEASITRLNIHTGNGRLQLKGATETVAFGFDFNYKIVGRFAKDQFSRNLHANNVRTGEEFHFLRLTVSPLTLKDGKIVKYFVKGMEDDSA